MLATSSKIMISPLTAIARHPSELAEPDSGGLDFDFDFCVKILSMFDPAIALPTLFGQFIIRL